MRQLLLSTAALAVSTALASHTPPIDRKRVVQSFNPVRVQSSTTTPLQVGNGNFAFGADVTGLQTFSPFNTLSTWGWHNMSLPTTPGQTEISDYHGEDWWTHGRLVNYNMPADNESDIGNWLIENPQRINLGTVGFSFGHSNVTEADLGQKTQTLDMWTGTIASSFVHKGEPVHVTTVCAPDSDTVAINIESRLLSRGDVGVFFDYPYPTVDKFTAPFVGVFNETSLHQTKLLRGGQRNTASIRHVMQDTTYYTHLRWDSSEAKVSGPDAGTHRYHLQSRQSDRLELLVTFSPDADATVKDSTSEVQGKSDMWWSHYWTSGAFVDLTSTQTDQAQELQRATIRSQYLLAVNSASNLPPQESGLTNNGWYGKFHMEMCFWHLMHFGRWNHWDLLSRSMPRTYDLMLPSARARAARQGYSGARWGKMTANSLADAPGEINTLLIWQQPHTMHFAELEYRSFPTRETLERWDGAVAAAADFMVSYGWWNSSDGYHCYQLGPPMYPVSENTSPNATNNPTFELAYWRFGLEVATRWRRRQGRSAPPEYADMLGGLCALPLDNGTYPIYQGIAGMWTDPATTTNHPAMTGIYGLLPPPSTGEPLDMAAVRKTAALVAQTWDLADSYGWDFAMLAMNSLRLGDADAAVAYLLNPTFAFDDAGYATGGTNVPTPYFPSAAALLLAVAMMAGGWDGSEGPHFPAGWDVKVEGFVPGL